MLDRYPYKNYYGYFYWSGTCTSWRSPGRCDPRHSPTWSPTSCMRDGRSAILNYLLVTATRITAFLIQWWYRTHHVMHLHYITVQYATLAISLFSDMPTFDSKWLFATIFFVLYILFITYGQCAGSGSVVSVCFCASWIRLYGYGSGSFY